MTAGHKHRHLRTTKGSLLHRLLTGPTLWVADGETADKSRLVYGPIADDPDHWRLSPLGLLHGLTGLTLRTSDEP